MGIRTQRDLCGQVQQRPNRKWWMRSRLIFPVTFVHAFSTQGLVECLLRVTQGLPVSQSTGTCRQRAESPHWVSRGWASPTNYQASEHRATEGVHAPSTKVPGCREPVAGSRVTGRLGAEGREGEDLLCPGRKRPPSWERGQRVQRPSVREALQEARGPGTVPILRAVRQGPRATLHEHIPSPFPLPSSASGQLPLASWGLHRVCHLVSLCAVLGYVCAGPTAPAGTSSRGRQESS